jgi:GlcNAc-PI de-N-acetylase
VKTALFVSPHFDDVAFSCPITVQRSVQAGTRTVIATVFSSGEGGEPLAHRAQCDARGCAMLGAEQVVLGLVDAPWRESFGAVDTIERVLLASLDQDRTTLAQAAHALQTLCEVLKPSYVFAPLGIGAHIDHRIAHWASRMIALPLRFYADQPYDRIEGARALRMRQLGMSFTAVGNAFVEHFANTPFIARVCLDRNRREVIARGLLNQAPENPTDAPEGFMELLEPAHATPVEIARAKEAIAAYGAEAAMFLGDDRHVLAESIWHLLPTITR